MTPRYLFKFKHLSTATLLNDPVWIDYVFKLMAEHLSKRRDNCFRGNMIHPINFIELKLDIIVPVQSEFYSPLYNNQFNVSSWATYPWGEVRLNWCEYGQFIELWRFRGERSFWWRQSWRWRFQVKPGRRRHPYKSFIPQGSQHWHGLEVKKKSEHWKQMSFQQIHNQGFHQLLLTVSVSWDLCS